MTADQFVNSLGNYYSKTGKYVLSTILHYVSDIPCDSLEVLFQHLQDTVSPKSPIGISDIKQACEQKGIPIRKKVLHKPREGIPVTCDCCGNSFTYVQGSSSDDHGSDKCTACGFPFYETYLYKTYKAMGLKSAYSNYERVLYAYKQTDDFINDAKRRVKGKTATETEIVYADVL